MANPKHEEHEEHQNHERWLLSYADFITLLFAFFVVMYSVSQIDQKKAAQIAQSVRMALHMDGDGVAPGALPGVRSLEVTPNHDAGTSPDRTADAAAGMQRRLAAAAGRGRPVVLVFSDGHKLVVRVSALALFETGKSTILPSAMPTLDAVLAELTRLQGRVHVEGHTDASAARPNAGAGDENWSLSALRAAAVVSYAQATNALPAERLLIEGYGSTRPLVDNATPEGRAQNRRVELVVDTSETPSP